MLVIMIMVVVLRVFGDDDGASSGCLNRQRFGS